MDRDISAAFRHCRFQLFHEQALAARLGQRHVEQFVATRGQGQQFDAQRGLQRFKPRFHVLRLPEGEPAAARRNRQFAFHSLPSGSTPFTAGHMRRLTGRRSSMPSSTTLQ